MLSDRAGLPRFACRASAEWGAQRKEGSQHARLWAPRRSSARALLTHSRKKGFSSFNNKTRSKPRWGDFAQKSWFWNLQEQNPYFLFTQSSPGSGPRAGTRTHAPTCAEPGSGPTPNTWKHAHQHMAPAGARTRTRAPRHRGPAHLAEAAAAGVLQVAQVEV